MLLEVSGLRAGYGQGDVLHGVHLAVDEGSLLVLLGPNGAGKSTLLKAIAGVVVPTAGSVTWRDRDLAGHGPAEIARCGVYLVPEGRAVFPSLTVLENLRLASGRPERQWGDQLDHGLDAFPVLRSRLTQTAGTLSGGEQQMLALARAFIAQPVLLLLDEPSLGLAPKVIEEVFEAIGRFLAEGIAIVLVEQYVRRALDLADTAVVLMQGQVRFAGRADVLTDDELAQHYLGDGSLVAEAGNR